MRLVSFLVAGTLVVVFGLSPAAAQTIFARGLSPCKNTFPKPGDRTPSQIAALDLLASLTQFDTARGKATLASNLETTVAINNQASSAARAQALKDALITDFNAYALADGLGEPMAKIYREKAIFDSDDGGRTTRCGEVGPAVSAFIASANAISGGDSNAGKFGFADGVRGRYKLPFGGIYDVLGKAYGWPADRTGADPYGNSRPFQTAPIGAANSPRIETYRGREFFGADVDSRAMLTGSPDPAVVGSDLSNNPSYPSGHTTFGYSEALALALMIPERLRALAYRGSEYGDSRIVIGAHYPVDVIGGRVLATYDMAQNLAGKPGYAKVDGRSFRAGLAAAARELRDYLKTNGCPSISVCARAPIVRASAATIVKNGRLISADPRRSFAFRLTYGLAPMGSTDLPPEPVPPEAAYLLQTRFPYLNADQRREVLRSTEGASGHFLDVDPISGRPLADAGMGPSGDAGVYSRLDLFAAAGGYAVFTDQVEVYQEAAAITDPDLQPFAELAREDVWSNDISGPGGLTKGGAGTLMLTGTCSYTGPTIIRGGTLKIDGSVQSSVRVEQGGTLTGSGSMKSLAVLSDGVLAPGHGGGQGLKVAGALSLAPHATFTLRGVGPETAVKVAGTAELNGATLMVQLGGSPRPRTRMTLLTAAGGISGTFAHVRTDTADLIPDLTYTDKAVYLTIGAPGER